MSDLRHYSRAFVEEFIEIYRSHECLWKIKSKWYSNRDKKRSAYEKLVEKMREVDPEADRDTVVKKINNLRSAYRKELKKVSDSKKSALGADNVYTPRLWYFNILSFLIDQETPRASTSNLDRFEDQDMDGDQDPLELPVNVQHSSETPTPPISRKRKRDVDLLRQRLMIKAEKCLDKEEDEYDSFGKYVAAKLRKLSEKQRIFAEKQIMDTLYNGAMNTISPSPISNVSDFYSSPSSSPIRPDDL